MDHRLVVGSSAGRSAGVALIVILTTGIGVAQRGPSPTLPDGPTVLDTDRTASKS